EKYERRRRRDTTLALICLQSVAPSGAGPLLPFTQAFRPGLTPGTNRAHRLQNRPGTCFTDLVRPRSHVKGFMPWKVSGVVEKRKQFLADYASGEWTMTDLCRAYQITRPTGYAVLQRYTRDGEAGLEERSRAPKGHPNQTPAEIEEQVLAL